MLEFKCPGCGFRKSNLEAKFESKKVICPKCQTQAVVQKSSSELQVNSAATQSQDAAATKGSGTVTQAAPGIPIFRDDAGNRLCHRCRGIIDEEAKVCRHCRVWQDPSEYGKAFGQTFGTLSAIVFGIPMLIGAGVLIVCLTLVGAFLYGLSDAGKPKPDGKVAAEQQRIAEEYRRGELQRIEDERVAEEKRIAEEERIAAEKRVAEEKLAAEEQKILEAEQKKIAAQAPITNSIGMQLKQLPSGSFTLKSKRTAEVSAAGWEEEWASGSFTLKSKRTGQELYSVTLTKPFAIGVYEVTQETYEKVMGENPSGRKHPQQPVTDVSWTDAVSFCQKLSELPEERSAGRSYRLPTDGEWDYACRAGSSTLFHFGHDDLNTAELVNYAWYRGNSENSSHPVGQKKPNPWGLYDMYGNVTEWCQDWAHPGSRRFEGKFTDPTGPSTGYNRVVRGGSFYDSPSGCCSVANRGWHTTYRSYMIGFRVVCVSPDE